MGKRVTSSGLHFREITLATVWKMDLGGGEERGVQQGRPTNQLGGAVVIQVRDDGGQN